MISWPLPPDPFTSVHQSSYWLRAVSAAWEHDTLRTKSMISTHCSRTECARLYGFLSLMGPGAETLFTFAVSHLFRNQPISLSSHKKSLRGLQMWHKHKVHREQFAMRCRKSQCFGSLSKRIQKADKQSIRLSAQLRIVLVNYSVWNPTAIRLKKREKRHRSHLHVCHGPCKVVMIASGRY